MEPLKLGIIGMGVMGAQHARQMGELDEIALTSVADVNLDTAATVGRETGAKPFDDYKKLIRKGASDGSLEAILIATPHYFHPPVAQYAARHGIHVLSEKPLAVSVKAADKMIQACRDNNVLLGVMFQQRTEPSRVKMKQMIEAGAIGEIYRISMVAPWYRPQFYYDSSAWRGTWRGEGGGILMNQSPHSLDQFAWMGGMPQTIQGVAATRLHHIEVENTSLSICDYGDGKTGTFYTSTADIPGVEKVEVFGDKGILSWQDGSLRHFQLQDSLSEHLRSAQEMFPDLKGQWHDVEVGAEKPDHLKVIQSFARAVKQNKPELLIATGEDGLRSLELANAMLMAGYTRREVSLPLDRNKYERMLNALRADVKPAQFRGRA